MAFKIKSKPPVSDSNRVAAEGTRKSTGKPILQSSEHNNQSCDFNQWRSCMKCHQPLVQPKALPCLHTICLRCLKIHYHIVQSQNALHAHQRPEKYNFFSWEGCFPCPVCHYPCYTLNGEVESLPTNTRLLRLTYTERLQLLCESQKSALLQSAGHEVEQVSKKAVSSNSAVTDGATHTGMTDTLTYAGIPAHALEGQFGQDVLSHWEHVVQECKGEDGPLLADEDKVLPGHKAAEKLYQYELRHGDTDLDLRHPNAIAVSPHTGHVVVVDTTWNKAVLYKSRRKPYSHKSFHHPIIDVRFCAPPKKGNVEQFCAMGRRADKKGIMVYTAPFNKDPIDFQCTYQKNIRDVSGLLIIEPDILLISLCYANTVIRQLNLSQFVDLATHSRHGIYYPTHMTYTVVGEVIISDTGNHRIGVFYGPEYLAFDFYGQFGSQYGSFFYPMGLAADKQRHLYICDTNNYRVQVFDKYFQFQSCPIRRTYLMGKSVAQDVKPIDCAVNNRQMLVVLFRGRAFMSLQVFKYFEPQAVYAIEDDAAVLLPRQPTCWLCCLRCWCCCSERRLNRLEYEPIQ